MLPENRPAELFTFPTIVPVPFSRPACQHVQGARRQRSGAGIQRPWTVERASGPVDRGTRHEHASSTGHRGRPAQVVGSAARVYVPLLKV
jgi:hypothetical protein